ncbi:MAG TPA: alpha/beta hydrolase-fold protein [Caldimonas sp.]|nr:alpha/beta hydrolase-fold protein [Caldimonas sp.]
MASAKVRPGVPAPVAVMLHGAGGDAEQGLGLLAPFASDAGWIVLAPASTAYTWDAIIDGLGPDVAQIDAGLRWIFERYDVAPAQIAVGGFSDGASYALTIGLAHGDLFRHVIALSPGFFAAVEPSGKPRLFIAHGTHDTVLPIDRCSRRIVPQLEGAGYDIVYREFVGGHEVRPQIVREAVGWAALGAP